LSQVIVSAKYMPLNILEDFLLSTCVKHMDSFESDYIVSVIKS
jgi:hypothetical protein